MNHDARRPEAHAWDEELRAHGYRVTPQRQLVLEAIGKLDHATPEEIAGCVQRTAKGVNMSTIYRTLELLDNLGLVTHHHLSDGAPTYHLASEPSHVHLVCQGCGRLSEVRPDAIKPLITALEKEQGFETDVAHLTVFGKCARCRASQDSASRDSASQGSASQGSASQGSASQGSASQGSASKSKG